MTDKRTLSGQPLAAYMPGSFWVIIQGHATIPDGRRFLVLCRDWRKGYWLAWLNGIKPRHTGTLLREKYFRREIDDDD